MNVVIGALVALYVGGVCSLLLLYERISEADLTWKDFGAALAWPWPVFVKGWSLTKPLLGSGATFGVSLLKRVWEFVKARVRK